jgi:hypothetical protein
MLKCYSIENLAFERGPVLDTVGALAPDRTKDQLSIAFSEDHFAAITEALFPLFTAYAMGQLLNCECETVGYSVFRLLQSNTSYLLSKAAIKARLREIHQHLRRQFAWNEILAAKHKVRSALYKGKVGDARFVSGKSYLCKILLRWFQQEANFRGNDRQLISLILEKSSLKLDPGLGRSLRRVARA